MDSTSRVYIEEVNTNGYIGGGMMKKGLDVLMDMLELAGVAGYDR